jgi:tetratricopeptide (TPR) repeat protein
VYRLPLLFASAALLLCHAADTVAILPLFNLNEAKSPDLDWIGESVAETIHESLSSAGLLVLAREDREEVYRRLAVRSGVLLTKASVMKIGETLDAGQVIFGEFKVEGTESGAPSLKANMRLTVHLIDLKKFKEGPVLERSGPLENLSQMEMSLAWLLLKYLSPGSAPVEADFLRYRPAVRVDAMESYVRGLMATTPEQKIKLFSQAARIDDHFSQPDFQLGRVFFTKKDYRSAAPWLAKVTRADSHFMEASFLLGICSYFESDFDGAVQQFRLVAAEVPLNEVFNNLGAALSRRNDPAALDNLQKALDGDAADPDYWFNVGYELWKQGQFTQAAERFRAVLDRNRNDQEATSMLGRCIKMDAPRAGDQKTEGRQRIKTAFEDSAFRQLKAELQHK